VGAGCIIQPGRPQVGDPITKVYIQQQIIDFDVSINTSVCWEYKPRLCFRLVCVQTKDSKWMSVNQGLAVPGFVCINQLLIYE